MRTEDTSAFHARPRGFWKTGSRAGRQGPQLNVALTLRSARLRGGGIYPDAIGTPPWRGKLACGDQETDR